jgi:hypothetical protein
VIAKQYIGRENHKKIHMLRSLLCASILLLVVFFFSFAPGATREPDECLDISGSVSAEGDSSDMVSVELVSENVQVEALEVHSFQPFVFHLLRDKQYTVKLVKKKFISKTISIATDMPKELQIKKNYKFHFETDLTRIPDSEATKMDALDYPIALVRYDAVKKKFEYSEKYSKMINDLIDKDLYKIYGGDGEAPPPKNEKKKK